MESINCGLDKIENDCHVLACAYAAIFLHNELANEGERFYHKNGSFQLYIKAHLKYRNVNGFVTFGLPHCGVL